MGLGWSLYIRSTLMDFLIVISSFVELYLEVEDRDRRTQRIHTQRIHPSQPISQPISHLSQCATLHDTAPSVPATVHVRPDACRAHRHDRGGPTQRVPSVHGPLFGSLRARGRHLLR